MGPAVGAVARMLGKPLMPWQQYVADVALEINEATGRLAYREIRLTVPRQSGKSTLVLAKAAHRCVAADFFGPRQRLVYTAQTRLKAKEKFKEDYAPDLEQARRLKARPSWAPGDEHLRFPNGSKFGIESNTEKAGHGGTLDEAYIDEAFAHIDNRLEQAFGPAMITRRNVQTFVISTAGWENASPFLWSKVEHGRRMIDEAEPSQIAYFEWSAPQDADPFDRETWRSCMPALGFTIDEAAIDAELQRMITSEDGLNGFRRAYLNQWVPKTATSVAIRSDWWEDCADVSSEIAGVPALAVSMTPALATVSLLAAGHRRDGEKHVEVIEHGESGPWFVPRVVDVARRHGAPVWLHPGHPAGTLLAELQAAGVNVQTLNTTEYAQACGSFYRAVADRKVHYRPPQPELTAAIQRASQRRSGETWRWEGEHITALVAATQALHGAQQGNQGGWAVSL